MSAHDGAKEFRFSTPRLKLQRGKCIFRNYLFDITTIKGDSFRGRTCNRAYNIHNTHDVYCLNCAINNPEIQLNEIFYEFY